MQKNRQRSDAKPASLGYLAGLNKATCNVSKTNNNNCYGLSWLAGWLRVRPRFGGEQSGSRSNGGSGGSDIGRQLILGLI